MTVLENKYIIQPKESEETKKLLCKKPSKKKITVGQDENSENINAKRAKEVKGDGKDGTNALHKKV